MNSNRFALLWDRMETETGTRSLRQSLLVSRLLSASRPSMIVHTLPSKPRALRVSGLCLHEVNDTLSPDGFAADDRRRLCPNASERGRPAASTRAATVDTGRSGDHSPASADALRMAAGPESWPAATDLRTYGLSRWTYRSSFAPCRYLSTQLWHILHRYQSPR